MPNWKTYESSVRLLSAIIAAHPNLKLDYGEIARFYGDDSAYKSVWDRMNTMSKHAKNLVAAVEAGQDPFTVPLVDSKGNSRAKAISDRFGGDCTRSAIDNRFRRIKDDAKMINEAIKKGIDPITLEIGTVTYREAPHARTKKPPMARAFGSDASANAIGSQFTQRYNPLAKRQLEMLDNGEDPKDVDLDSIKYTYNKGIKAHIFGTDATPKALRCQVQQQMKAVGDHQLDMLAKGLDPKDIDITTVKYNPQAEVIKYMGDDVTASAISWQISQRIRPIGQRQLAMRNAGLDPANIDLDTVKPTKGGNGQEFHLCFFVYTARSLFVTTQIQEHTLILSQR
ncbi:hypothetical protein B0J14DRAFT_490240 [Halenospora varia]|nr:hypothetical protein B0J14DRAFT_490240 [Halenospora varia]